MSDIYKYDTDEILSPDEEVIHDQNKTIECLREQLAEANEVIKEYMALGKWNDFYNEYPGMVADDMEKYLEKWGVK